MAVLNCNLQLNSLLYNAKVGGKELYMTAESVEMYKGDSNKNSVTIGMKKNRKGGVITERK